jgi:hypothetical protein
MKLNWLERMAVKNSVRAAHQHRREAASTVWMPTSITRNG